MTLRVLSAKDISELLTMEEAIDLLDLGFHILSDPNQFSLQPLRDLLWLKKGSQLLGLMHGAIDVGREERDMYFGIKVLSVFMDNHHTEFDSHQGAISLFEGDHGQLVSLIEAGALTKIRTAAASGLATKYLARSNEEGPFVLGILGAGVQADSHIEAMLAVRDICKVIIWNRSFDKAQTLAESATLKYGVEVVATESIEEAVSSSDILCTTTGAREPIVKAEWIKPGCHINAVGACTPVSRELDSNTVLNASLFTDYRESLENEAGEYLIPLQEGVISADHLQGELSGVVTGITGRKSSTEVTLFKSLGIAMEDLVCSQYLYKKAESQNKGTTIPNFAKI
eukprot:TRINITY_DN11528_c0_g1_i1.p1 TRINITY_DN11528_c0_g1~~TRINITY_DN11528_c0_g1_i1.p1  ORF type:complete len:341 (-),score=71.25 TRINITY_DN11528_c0_g1_i1:189-1211(-)